MPQKDSGSRTNSIVTPILGVLFVCSVALNFLLWRWGDTQTQRATTVEERLLATQSSLQAREEQALLIKSMMGVGALTEAEMDVLMKRGSGDPDTDVIARQFARDMDLFAPDVEFKHRNYPALSTYLNFANNNAGDTAKSHER